MSESLKQRIADLEVKLAIVDKLREEIAALNNQKPVAYVAWRDGKLCWDSDDCVCEDAVYPVDWDDDRVSMPVYLAAGVKADETITRLQGEAGVMLMLLGKALDVLYTIDSDCATEHETLEELTDAVEAVLKAKKGGSE